MPRVLVTGATGFTGRYVVRRLAEAGHMVTAFVRPESSKEEVQDYVAAFAVGDLSDPASLRRALDGHDALVNVASIGFGHAEEIVNAAREVGVDQAIYFSTTSLFTTLPAASKVERLKAETVIQSSSTPWTILRPTMIYGDTGDRNLIRLIRWIDRCKIVPVFGPGTYLVQPVHADDLAQAVVSALDSQGAARGKAYNLSGGTALSYNELVRLVGSLLGRSPWLVHFPVNASLLAVDVARRIPFAPRLSREQVLRLNENKAFAHDEAARDLRYAPRALRDGLEDEVRLYREMRG